MKRVSVLSFMLLLQLLSCARSHTSIPEGRLECLWAVQPEGAEEEPWFARIGSSTVTVMNNHIYVGDILRGMVLQLDNQGRFIRHIGGRGSGPGEFVSGPRRISISPSGVVYCQDGGYDFNKYSPKGEFLGKTTLSFSDPDILMGESPVVYDDSTVVWRITPRRNRESGIDLCLQIPPLLAVQEEEFKPLGIRYLSDTELEVMRSLIHRNPRDEHIQCLNFTSGTAIPHYLENEVIFVKNGSPYTVHRFPFDRAPAHFTFYEPDRHEWIEEIQLPSEEFRELGLGHSFQYRGPNHDSRRRITHMYAFTHSLRGMALRADSLAIFVEIIRENFQPSTAPEEAIEQYLYVVDLLSEKAVMRAEIDPPLPQLVLHGMCNDGTLIFSTNEPVPGILAYTIEPKVRHE